jgi:hypothetical protein
MAIVAVLRTCIGFNSWTKRIGRRLLRSAAKATAHHKNVDPSILQRFHCNIMCLASIKLDCSYQFSSTPTAYQRFRPQTYKQRVHAEILEEDDIPAEIIDAFVAERIARRPLVELVANTSD